MPDEIDRINETAEDRAAGKEFSAAAFASSTLPPEVVEALQSATAKIARRQSEAHLLALRSGKGVEARMVHHRGRVTASFEVTSEVPIGQIRWVADPVIGFGGWPE